VLKIFLLALLLFPLMAPVRAQSTNASLNGRVTDPSQALVAGARVAAVSDGTNLRYEALTNASGEYYISNLPPGGYHLEVEKPDFKKLLRPDLVLHVQDALDIDFEMALGDTSETVNVEAGAPLVNTESGTVSTVVDRAFVENLPLNGRSFQTLILLTPGVVVSPSVFDDQGQFSVNGQRADANYFTIDGVSANFGVTAYTAMVQTASGALPALSVGGGTNSLVSVDAMQEFRVQTSSFAPEFGRTPGAQISIVTRSGSNAFHGTLFEYFRNDKLDARDWFVNYNGLAKPAERQNDFGGVVGGPVVKNKTFFFFSYEGLRPRQPATQQTAVPDAASRQQAPAAIQPYLNAYPLPNGPALGPGIAQFNASYSNPSALDAVSLRVDHEIGSRLSLFARYHYSPSDLVQRGPLISSGDVLSQTNSESSYVHTGTLGLTQSISPRISNEVRANYSNQSLLLTANLDSFGGAVPLPDSVLFPSGISSGNGTFGFYIPGVGQYSQGKSGFNEQRQINFIDDLSVTEAGHRLKFGVDYRWLAPFTSPFSYRQFAQFTGMSAAPGGALSGMAGTAATFTTQGDALISKNFSLYAQDTWKIKPRLTLTYGLRWDVNPPLKGKNGANQPFTVTGLDNPANFNPAAIALAPRGTALYDTTYRNVAPRLGLAWQVREKPNWGTTLRAGFGIFYDLGQGSLGGVTSYFPYTATKIISPSPTPFPLSAPNAAAPAISLNPPVTTINLADPHLKLPRSYQWNVALEQSLGNSQSLSLTYIGAIGRDLLRVTQFINLNPNFQFIGLTDNSATSDYHALQLKFQRRLSRGLQALASYTFSHSIDSASTDAFANYLNTPSSLATPNLDRGDSDFDIRHSFTTGLTYDLPAPGSDKTVRTILGGWSLDSFVTARSAPPVGLGFTAIRSGIYDLNPRPNLVPGVPLELFGPGYPGGKIINKQAFSQPPAGLQGDLGRNVLRGFNAAQADLGLFGRSTQTLANSLGTGGGQGGGFNPLYQIGGPRSIQLAVKLQF
jgi:Carboxypeptidase regulatory-like domain/TonB dependent receptor